MDRYWSYVATPFFFTVIGFGIFALFSAQESQLESTKGATATAELIASAFNPAAAIPVKKPTNAPVTRG